MKYRVIASLLVIAALFGVAVWVEDQRPASQPSAPVQSSDDKALKSLSIN